jgi:hypothetical protein
LKPFSEQFSALLKEFPAIATVLRDLVESSQVNAVAPEAEFKILKETLLYIELLLATRQDLTSSQRGTVITELLNKGGSLLLSTSRSHTRESGKILSFVTSAMTSLFGSWNYKDQEAYIESETRRLLVTTSDAHFLAGLRDLLAEEPTVLGDIISRTITMATTHLCHQINKLTEITVGKAVQIQQDALKERQRRSMEESLSRNSLRILIEEMGKETPSAP